MRAQAIAFCFSFIVSVSVVLSSPALAQGAPESRPIGKVVIVTGSVSIERSAAVAHIVKLTPSPGALAAGDPLYVGDVIQTAPDGKAGITFADGTAFNISGNARIALDEFVYDPNGKTNATVFTLSKGTFTLIAGQAAKTGTMKVETPVATLGIRGTTPHVEIADDGTVSFATLIEEGKSQTIKKRQGRTPEKQRKAAIHPERFNDLDKNIGISLKICRGC